MKQSRDPISQGHSPTCPLFPVTIQKQRDMARREVNGDPPSPW